MKLHNSIKVVLYSLTLIMLFSCSREDELSRKSIVDLSLKGKKMDTPFDQYLKREFTDKYNIRVLYDFEVGEVSNSDVTPAKKEMAIRMVNIIKYLLIEPYEKLVGKDFLRKYYPKKIVLVGSGSYDGGTETLATADGGVRIIFYGVNNITDNTGQLISKSKLVNLVINTVYHEFSHILHQTKPISPNFEKISAGNYVGTKWNRYWGAGKLSIDSGFVSDYASYDKHEDFVELIARYVTLSDAKFASKIKGNNIINNEKLPLVKSYLKNKWNIDLDELRKDVQYRISNLENIDLDNIK